ncbi:hypothetical protein BR93DRAFT_924887 [Coniochaeta sp. PMI_546]|nr:hypothetical protein BR93DRAFT_924887 [Coniochaeta sp. PMI_546]
MKLEDYPSVSELAYTGHNYHCIQEPCYMFGDGAVVELARVYLATHCHFGGRALRWR